jgi:hypothetical protein
MGFEPTTSFLAGTRSSPLSYGGLQLILNQGVGLSSIQYRRNPLNYWK